MTNASPIADTPRAADSEADALAAFSRDVVAFLSANAPLRPKHEALWGEGVDRVFIFPERDPREEQADLALARTWRARVFDAGFGWLTGPVDAGGAGLAEIYQHAYRELEAEYDVPPEAWFTISCHIIAPTIQAYGTDAVKAAYLRRIHRGEMIACQLLSEPEAGSDLAGVQTTAVRDGDEWVVTGQKVWTSGAQYADLGELICRTDLTVPKHQGMSAFVVDMHAPGVTVRPLRQMSGGASFNEVFLDGVRVRDDHRLGAEGDGWSVALKTLMTERAAFAEGSSGMEVNVDRVIELFRRHRPDDIVVRDRLIDLWVRSRLGELTNRRLFGSLQPGQPPGPEMSIGKLLATDTLTRASDVVSRILGPALVADIGEWGTFAWSEFVLSTPGARIASGSDEIQRTILGERILGLPREPSVTATVNGTNTSNGRRAQP